MPDHVRVSFPKPLFELIRQGHGQEEALKICQISNDHPCLTIRANTLKSTRDDLLHKFKNEYGYNVQKTKYAPNGIRFMKNKKKFTSLAICNKKSSFKRLIFCAKISKRTINCYSNIIKVLSNSTNKY